VAFIDNHILSIPAPLQQRTNGITSLPPLDTVAILLDNTRDPESCPLDRNRSYLSVASDRSGLPLPRVPESEPDGVGVGYRLLLKLEHRAVAWLGNDYCFHTYTDY